MLSPAAVVDAAASTAKLQSARTTLAPSRALSSPLAPPHHTSATNFPSLFPSAQKSGPFPRPSDMGPATLGRCCCSTAPSAAAVAAEASRRLLGPQQLPGRAAGLASCQVLLQPLQGLRSGALLQRHQQAPLRALAAGCQHSTGPTAGPGSAARGHSSGVAVAAASGARWHWQQQQQYWGQPAAQGRQMQWRKQQQQLLRQHREVPAVRSLAAAAGKREGKRGKQGESAEEAGGAYKGSINLPVTTFGMRANAVEREPQIHRMWDENRVAQRLQETNPGTVFTLHDGPPYANGDLHIGHALNKILKDIINRYQMLQGRKVRYIPGWDCHGLPIELKVLQNMDKATREGLTPIKLRKKAAQFALKTVDKQRQSFKRYGVWGDWEEPYLTLRPEYEAAQMGVFGAMFLRGHIYRGRKPVHWSPSSRTALAEAELEYPEGHTSRSMYAAFRLSELSDALAAAVGPDVAANQVALAIWTTTPWTIPGNAAVAVNGKLAYSVVKVVEQQQDDAADAAAPPAAATADSAPAPSESSPAEAQEKKGPRFGKGARNGGRLLDQLSETAAAAADGAISSSGSAGPQYVVVATELVEEVQRKWKVALEAVAEVAGSALEGSRYLHPLEARLCPVVVGGDYITTESGTGLVHTAPGHGQEDYATGLKHGLPLISPVDDEGKFTAEAGERLAGLSVLAEGNVEVMTALDEGGSLLLEEKYEHKYPYDWRTKLPTIFRATDQWFASVQGFREAALEAIRGVQWVPPQGEKRITAMTESRGDWCISRQRVWGVPIPAFYHVDTGEPLVTEETIAHVQEIIRSKGSDAWYEMEVEDLLPPSLKHVAPQYKKGTDTMDVWFDSGSSWAAVLRQREGVEWPADMYVEGSDQHRGWFQSSLLTSVAAEGVAPYKRVLTHGFVLDERGYKMSKSLGNVVDPMAVINGGKNQKTEPAYGADVLRLWVSSVDYSSDVMIGPNIVRQMSDIYRKLRGTIRFMLGNLDGFEPETDAVAYEDLPAMDRFALYKLAGVMEEVKRSYDDFQFFRFFQLVQRFAVVDLSNFYFDVSKDRLYVGGRKSLTRRACQTVLHHHTACLMAAMAPVLPHLAEDAWENLPDAVRRYTAAASSSSTAAAAAGSVGAAPPASVFEVLWPDVPAEWSSLAPEDVEKWTTLLEVRGEVNKVMEQARMGKLIGANLDAKVYLHTPDAGLTDVLRSVSDDGGRLKWGLDNSVDTLRTICLSSQAVVVDTQEAAEALGLQFTATAPISWSSSSKDTQKAAELAAAAEGAPENTNGSTNGATAAAASAADEAVETTLWIGVGPAEGAKCERCWNYSVSVGQHPRHATLCDRCAVVVVELEAEAGEAVAPASASVPA